jgi:hypothetical protein
LAKGSKEKSWATPSVNGTPTHRVRVSRRTRCRGGRYQPVFVCSRHFLDTATSSCDLTRKVMYCSRGFGLLCKTTAIAQQLARSSLFRTQYNIIGGNVLATPLRVMKLYSNIEISRVIRGFGLKVLFGTRRWPQSIPTIHQNSWKWERSPINKQVFGSTVNPQTQISLPA